VREIRTLRAMWRVLETELRKLLTGHEGGNAGHSQGVSYEFVAPALDPTSQDGRRRGQILGPCSTMIRRETR
jgi:hypothetical protein